MPESIEEFYVVDWGAIKRALSRTERAKILVQVPEGLKPYAPEIAERISVLVPDAEVVIDLNPIYGSCMIMPEYIRDYEVIVHLGHDPYPLWRSPRNIVYVGLRSKVRASEEVVRELGSVVRSEYGTRVALYTTHQHFHDVERVASLLMDEGVTVVNDLKSSVITGCWFSDLDRAVSEGVNALIVYAGGRFHALGMGLRVGGKVPILRIDPYRNTIEDFTAEVLKVLRLRYGKIRIALDAETFMIIDGVSGQHRPNLVALVTKSFKKIGASVFTGRAFILNIETLRNLDSSRIGAYIITSCPRLAIEDLASFHKPVLTPGEALMVAKRSLGRYVFPW